MNDVIPSKVRLAAKRAFVRTSAQTLSATIPTSGITGAALSGGDPVVIAWSVGAAVLSSVAAATASALSIVSKGVPEEYKEASAS